MSDLNREMLETVIANMGDLADEVVFLGGAVAGLLITAPGGDPVRETDDVDCIIEVGVSHGKYNAIERRLEKLGWKPGSALVPGDPLCRFRKGGLTLDVMPTKGDILGFSADWASEAMVYAKPQPVGARIVRIVSAPYFIALKLEAFAGRGRNDFYASHDLEDLVVVVEGRPSVVDEVRLESTAELRAYLSETLERMWDQLTSDAIPGAVRGDPARARVVEARLAAMRRRG